jgi:hypothetical protein
MLPRGQSLGRPLHGRIVVRPRTSTTYRRPPSPLLLPLLPEERVGVRSPASRRLCRTMPHGRDRLQSNVESNSADSSPGNQESSEDGDPDRNGPTNLESSGPSNGDRGSDDNRSGNRASCRAGSSGNCGGCNPPDNGQGNGPGNPADNSVGNPLSGGVELLARGLTPQLTST